MRFLFYIAASRSRPRLWLKHKIICNVCVRLELKSFSASASLTIFISLDDRKIKADIIFINSYMFAYVFPFRLYDLSQRKIDHL
jgi:hypothetical protein